MARKKDLDDNKLTDSTYYILISLVKEKHGYKIMQDVSDLSQGSVEIGPASLYTIIKKLIVAELIVLVNQSEDRKKIYSLTSKGKEVLKKDIKRREMMVEIGYKAIKAMEEGKWIKKVFLIMA